ncbi:MAG: hypothetical protein NZM11_04215 [Anaerolineales bacterium]|nr:hypothetical protein [Anaerolineales bacterium]
MTTIRRWLKNLRVDVWEFYRPVLERALQEKHAKIVAGQGRHGRSS